jgi:hypothetical protein
MEKLFLLLKGKPERSLTGDSKPPEDSEAAGQTQT